MIRLIILDAHGVLFRGGYPATARVLAKRFHHREEDVYAVIYTKYLNQAALKKITQRAAWQKAISELELPLTVAEIKAVHYGELEPNRPVIGYVRRLQQKFRTIMLTKNTRSQLAEINAIYPEVGDLFKRGDVVNTWEYNLPKASRETVLFVSRRFGVKPAEMVYIDDQEANLSDAQRMGVRTVLYKTYNQFRRDLNSLIS